MAQRENKDNNNSLQKSSGENLEYSEQDYSNYPYSAEYYNSNNNRNFYSESGAMNNPSPSSNSEQQHMNQNYYHDYQPSSSKYENNQFPNYSHQQNHYYNNHQQKDGSNVPSNSRDKNKTNYYNNSSHNKSKPKPYKFNVNAAPFNYNNNNKASQKSNHSYSQHHQHQHHQKPIPLFSEEDFDENSHIPKFNNNNNKGPSQTKNYNKYKNNNNKSSEKIYDNSINKNQRERLTNELQRVTYDCIVCFDKIRRYQATWNCPLCYNVFHLNCLDQWASSSKDDQGWRCPSCQNIQKVLPKKYFCFCGKTENPNRLSEIPHACDKLCGRLSGCEHGCSLPCHPGACSPCEVQIKRFCPCGKTSANVICNSKSVITCNNICGKLKNCQKPIHACNLKCHLNSCFDCDQKVILVCFCKKSKKEADCNEENSTNPGYNCGEKCEKILKCGCRCPDKCHFGPCNLCKLSIEAVLSCPCGQTPIDEACRLKKIPSRKRCRDPVPTCSKTCNKIQPCNHKCLAICHFGDCKPCPLSSEVSCRCGNKQIEVQCQEWIAGGTEVLCEKKCSKKRICGRHRCNSKCCIYEVHICPIVCNRQLSCGNCNCERLCHAGNCTNCGKNSYEELRCECGKSVIYPPVPCGTQPPACNEPCIREHECDHPVNHKCHSDPECPPCTTLVQKWCYGKHEIRQNIPCHVNNISCGLVCKMIINCPQKHSCPKICHRGICFEEGQVCKLPCLNRRKCGHICGLECHHGDCPETKCKHLVEAICKCGHRKVGMVCWKKEIEYQNIIEDALAQKLDELKKEEEAVEIDLENIKTELINSRSNNVVLDCDKECARVERNRKFAEALKLVDNDPSTTDFSQPDYSDFLKSIALKNPQFAEMVHNRMEDLLKKLKKTDKNKKNLTYSFEPMNREKRTFVHEYSDHFSILSESYDEEPNRNVIITASKEKSRLPSVSLTEIVFPKNQNVKLTRKNIRDEVNICEPPKNKIMGPALKMGSTNYSGMVKLGMGNSNNPAQSSNHDS